MYCENDDGNFENSNENQCRNYGFTSNSLETKGTYRIYFDFDANNDFDVCNAYLKFREGLNYLSRMHK